MSVNDVVGCENAIASKLAPTGFAFLPSHMSCQATTAAALPNRSKVDQGDTVRPTKYGNGRRSIDVKPKAYALANGWVLLRGNGKLNNGVLLHIV